MNASPAKSDADDALALVDRLQTISIASEGAESSKEAADILEDLAVQLRSSETRDALSCSDLPRHLSEVFSRTENHVAASLSLIEQTGRAAANLAANCDAGRDALVEAGYIANCCRVLDRCCGAIEESLATVKALTVSLLNMVIEGHEKALEALSVHSSSLSNVSAALFKMPDIDGEGKQVLQWIWTLIGLISEDQPTMLLPDMTKLFSVYLDANKTPPPVPVLASAADVLDTWCNAGEVDADAYAAHIPLLSEFIEKAVWRGDAEGADEAEEDTTGPKAFAGVKGSLINALVGLSSSVPPFQNEFWSTMQRWLALPNRDDLQCCALLSYGNRAREDSSATQLLSSDYILPAIRQSLQPGVTAQVLHSVIGLLRNLAIPESNKVVLGETDLLEKLLEVGVWSTEKDMLGSVQGGAVGIVKNMCRGNVRNTKKLASNSEAIDQILDLLQRTDDPAIRFESTRVFVNCIRSMCSDATERSVLRTFEDERIVLALLDLFKDSGPYPVLANESIIALALLATFGSSETVSIVRLGVSDQMGRVVDVLAPKEGDEAGSKEVRANLVTLLRQIDAREVGILDIVKDAFTSARGDGRVISDEGYSL